MNEHQSTRNTEAEEEPILQMASSMVESTGVNLFLTGKAGTGKTTFLRNLSATTGKRHVILAPTGVAAINAGGSTLHSFFQLSFGPFIPGVGYSSKEESIHRMSSRKKRLIRTLDLLIIDEISMVRPDVLDAVDETLRRLRHSSRPFGGVQLLLIGDLRQLAPVVNDQEWELLGDHYPSPYFFESHALKKAGFMMLELTKVFRQSDPVFLDILNKIRDNIADAETLRLLNSRADREIFPAKEEGVIRLTSHNYRANAINEKRLAELSESPIIYEARVTGNFPETSYPADTRLELKVGAQVMFVKNDPSGSHLYYNGLIGEVAELAEAYVVVIPISQPSAPIKVERVDWENTRYALNEEGNIVEITEGTFSQIPLRLAWAITIHKSQGLTFDKAIVDAAHSFAPGQTYVALSRCRSLDGLYLDSPLSASSIFTDSNVNTFINCHPRMKGDSGELEGFRNAYFNQLLYELFDMMELSNLIDSWYRAATSILPSVYPTFVSKVYDVRSDFNEKVEKVSNRLMQFLSSSAPYRQDEEFKPKFDSKIAGGCRYFSEELKNLKMIVDATPLGIDNKALLKRLRNSQEELSSALALRIALMEAFKEKDFAPELYLTTKSRKILELDSEGSVRLPRLRQSQKEKKGEKLEASATLTDDILDPELYSRLMEWRRTTAGSMPAYMVFPNKTLIAISNARPANMQELIAIKGVSSKKANTYGSELLDIISG